MNFELLANLITGCETTLSVLYSQITTIFCTLHIFDLLKGQLISDHISPYQNSSKHQWKANIFLTHQMVPLISFVKNQHRMENFNFIGLIDKSQQQDKIWHYLTFNVLYKTSWQKKRRIYHQQKEALHFNAYICSTAIYYEYFKYMHLEFF